MTTPDITAWPDIFRMADQAKRKFGLKILAIEPMTHMKARHFADCEQWDDDTHECKIRLRVHVLGRATEPLKWSTLVRKLAHELAHVKCFELYGRNHKHSRHFYQFMREVLAYWREQGWKEV